MAVRSTFPRSSVLILGYNSIQSLLPTTTLSQAESLLDLHRIDDVVLLADQLRKKLESKLTVDEDEAEELRYVFQRIGFQHLIETRFEDAGYNLFEGDLDPRILISYFPDLRGELLSPDDEIDMYAGVADHMAPYDSVDDIISANLVRNYSPHLAPNTRSAPPTAELRRILGIAALDMLEAFLRKWRRVRGGGSARELRMIVDTVLAKLFARAEKTTDLYALLKESPDLVLPELEPVFVATGQYNALCSIYEQRGDDEKLLEAWSKMVEGEWSDPEIPDPLSNMLTLLVAKRNRALIQQWGIWLTTKDPERALKLLTSQGSNKRNQKTGDDLAMLQQIRAANPEAGLQFLEHLVLQRRSTDRALHTELAMACVDQVVSALSEDSISKLWRAKSASYASSPSSTPFLSYFSATTPDSPSKRSRIRAVLFLQNSAYYDVQSVRERLAPHERILSVEIAILEGKLGNHQTALTMLARTVRDHTSAEAYCTTCGCVLPPRTGATLAEQYGLGLWALTPKTQATPPTPTKDEEETRRLLRMLLEVYMSGCDLYPAMLFWPASDNACRGDAAATAATANLLNSQAMNFDTVDVLELVPPSWPLPTLSAFLTRSFRRTLHAKHEGLIIKGASMGQNLVVADETHAVLRAQGALIEEPLSPSSSAPSTPPIDEKPLPVVDEKVGLHEDGATEVAEIEPESYGSGATRGGEAGLR
ncbi:hypothetical protein OF83DRAFT_1287071 [Amylostereum chailletii]|nr:hypothetical protein OF83DRAFT_1287071 [Amylostereum chailletii]